MSTIIDLFGLDKRISQLRSLARLDASRLMDRWEDLVVEDNRRGIMQGLDKDGVPLAPVTYRPVVKPAVRVSKSVKGESAYQKHTRYQFRLGQNPKLKQGEFHGRGAFISGINNNLSTAEYQLLGGPPLAPRDQFSRVITNLKTTYTSPSHGARQWAVIAAWDEVVNRKGQRFLHYHFDGIGQKRRDLRGIRPAGVAKAREALRNWARLTIREHFA
jgi:hypothetical protein